MKMCKSCHSGQVGSGGYIGPEDVAVSDAKECQIHPTLDNWRTLRTMKAIKAWSLEGEGYRHPNCRGVNLTLCGGHVHRRTAEAILFDYEKPMIDLLVHEGMLKIHEGIPTTLTVTKKGDDWLRAQVQSGL